MFRAEPRVYAVVKKILGIGKHPAMPFSSLDIGIELFITAFY